MFFIIDTCFWLHVKEIYLKLNIDLRTIICRFKWGFPESIVKELEHYQELSWIPMDSAYIFPISEAEYDQAIQKYPFLTVLDRPDQEIILISHREDAIILSDDGEINITAKILQIKSFPLPYFLLFLKHHHYCDKTIINSIFRFWMKIHRYGERNLSRWKAEFDLEF